MLQRCDGLGSSCADSSHQNPSCDGAGGGLAKFIDQSAVMNMTTCAQYDCFISQGNPIPFEQNKWPQDASLCIFDN